jgi:hypothetical protein
MISCCFPVETCRFLEFEKRQSKSAKGKEMVAAGKEFGLDTAERFHAFLVKLRARHMPLRTLQSTDALHNPSDTTWPLVFVLMCEVRQSLNALTRAAVSPPLTGG